MPPGGGMDWPNSGYVPVLVVPAPQHSTLPLLFTPQVWPLPALKLSNVPLGGVDWPWVKGGQGTGQRSRLSRR
jgi:hypothetical protein